MPDKPSILDQLLAEAMERGAASARDEDFAVNLRNADGDEVTGIPISQARRWLHDKFGIGDGEGDGGSGQAPEGDTGKGAQGAGNVVKQYFGKQQRQQPPAGGKQASG